MQALHKKVLELLQDTAVTPRSHPVLISLLQMAWQGGGLGRKAPAAAKQQQARALGKVVAAFKHALASGITDEKLRAAMPFPGLFFSDEGGWKVTAAIPLTYRELIADALDLAANKDGGALKPFAIETLGDLRSALKANHLPSMEATIRARGKLECSELLPGRRLIVRYVIHGRGVFSLLQSDEFGRLRALTHERSTRNALKFHAKTLPKS